SVIGAAELAYGAANSARIESNKKVLELFLNQMQVLPWTQDAIWIYGSEKARLKKLGTPTGELDLMLGSQAIALGYVFVTNNTKHFERIEGLRLENWVL
ncbi:MAG: hypothetical protein RLZZ502_991, partial [Pseudomonadota bacterium]